MRVALGLLTLCNFGQGPCSTTTPVGEPAWRWTTTIGVEWVREYSVADAAFLLVCAKDATLFLLDANTGKTVLESPIRAQRGVRAAPQNTRSVAAQPNEFVIYCLDRYAVYAISVERAAQSETPRAKLKWRAGDRPRVPDERQGDPEFLSNIVAAHATPNGVIVTRNDGRTALLRAADGRVAWSLALDRVPLGRIHIDDPIACVVWKSGRTTNAAFFAAARPAASEPAVHRLVEPWPPWTGMAGGRLIAVWPNRIVVCDARGEIRRHNLNWKAEATIAALGLFEAGGEQTWLIAGDAQGRVHAIDIATGAELWNASPGEENAGAWSCLRVIGDTVLVMNADAWAALSAKTGKVVRFGDRQAGIEGRVLGAHVRGGYVFVLRESHAGVDGNTSLTLKRLPMEPGVGKDPPPVSLETRGTPRRVIWWKDRLLLVEPNGVRAYILP